MVVDQRADLLANFLADGALTATIPVPGAGTGLMTPDGNLSGYIDRSFLPGILFGEVYEREGLFATLPTVTTVLMGALAGYASLRSRPP